MALKLNRMSEPSPKPDLRQDKTLLSLCLLWFGIFSLLGAVAGVVSFSDSGLMGALAGFVVATVFFTLKRLIDWQQEILYRLKKLEDKTNSEKA